MHLKMSTWLKLLPLELSEITEYVEPQTELDPQKFHVLGEMTEDLKKLYTLWFTLAKQKDEYLLAARYAKDEKEEKLNLTRAIELGEKTEVVKQIFWISLRDEFNLWNKLVIDEVMIGVSKGFKVVWSERPSGPRNLLDYLRGL